MNVLIVSDIHANLAAIEAVLAAAPSVESLWNLGDTIGYGPRPRECLDLRVDRFASPVLVGNHDLACIGEVDLREFNPVAQVASRWTALQLGLDHRAYLQGLPAKTVVDGFTLAHGSPRAPIWEYVTNAAIATENFDHFETAACFVGHTHLAMCAVLKAGEAIAEVRPWRDGETLDLRAGRYLLNPGSVGQPRDRDPRAAYALWDVEAGRVDIRRVVYDIDEARRKIEAAGLPRFLADRLAAGA
jgi:diadenosine tetraphosphatase ApaH/serine/threonine PP2A family protein phosphatase